MENWETSESSVSVEEFINSFVDKEQKRKESFELIELMHEVTGYEPKMWGPSIIGFGSYHYKYESGNEGDAPLVAFSPRKAAISLYVFSGLEEHKYLLDNLGEFQMGTTCIYAKKLSDIDQNVLKDLMKETVSFIKTKYSQ